MIKLSVKVPIRNKRKRRSIQKTPESRSTNEGEWLKQLADEGKLISLFEATTNNASEFLTFIIPAGKTFYLISANAGATDAQVATCDFRTNTDVFARATFNASQTSVTMDIQGFSIVGDGINTINCFTNFGASANIIGYLENTPVTSSRGSTVVIPA